MASKRALWVLGDALLISSARTILERLARLKRNFSFIDLFDDGGASDVGRHKVRGALNPAVIKAQAGCRGLRQQRLGESWIALQKGMASCKDGNQELLDGHILADYDFVDLAPELFEDLWCSAKDCIQILRHYSRMGFSSHYTFGLASAHQYIFITTWVPWQ
jgi:hypothetical protein